MTPKEDGEMMETKPDLHPDRCLLTTAALALLGTEVSHIMGLMVI